MKRYLTFILAVIMLVSLFAGCGSENGDATNGTGSSTETGQSEEPNGGTEAEADPGKEDKDELDANIPEEYSQMADELVNRYENYINIGIGCKLDFDWEIEGDEIIGLLPEEKRDLVNMPIKAPECATYEEALEETYKAIDASLMDQEILDFTAGLYVVYNDELYFFWGNKGLITYQDTAVEDVTDNGMVVTSDLYTSGGELYKTDKFTIEKIDDHYKIVSMEIVAEYY